MSNQTKSLQGAAGQIQTEIARRADGTTSVAAQLESTTREILRTAQANAVMRLLREASPTDLVGLATIQPEKGRDVWVKEAGLKSTTHPGVVNQTPMGREIVPGLYLTGHGWRTDGGRYPHNATYWDSKTDFAFDRMTPKDWETLAKAGVTPEAIRAGFNTFVAEAAAAIERTRHNIPTASGFDPGAPDRATPQLTGDAASDPAATPTTVRDPLEVFQSFEATVDSARDAVRTAAATLDQGASELLKSDDAQLAMDLLRRSSTYDWMPMRTVSPSSPWPEEVPVVKTSHPGAVHQTWFGYPVAPGLYLTGHGWRAEGGRYPHSATMWDGKTDFAFDRMKREDWETLAEHGVSVEQIKAGLQSLVEKLGEAILPKKDL